MYARAVTALATTAAALLLAAGPAVADDDWRGPDDTLCERFLESLDRGSVMLPMSVVFNCMDADDARRFSVTFD
ncbi:hypothetical protein [Nonomuraea sp. NPDC003709]|uniref:hypothetical protein n=1 Tax=Nonomuraea sp. NPDC003709 TaxID=3154450 RepID=UPI0033AA8A8D